jgi:uracil-DNA glycosylase
LAKRTTRSRSGCGATKPAIIVCLGATAAQPVFGSDYRVTKERGKSVAHPWANTWNMSIS